VALGVACAARVALVAGWRVAVASPSVGVAGVLPCPVLAAGELHADIRREKARNKKIKRASRLFGMDPSRENSLYVLYRYGQE
jgi:hypothetical protein